MDRTRKVDFDDYAQQYDALLARDTSFFADTDYFAEYKVALAAHRIAGPVRRIHEFGCGTGRNLPIIARYFPGAEIWASDISSQSLELARAAAPGATVWQEGIDTPRAPCVAQDLIFVAGVFHHVAPRERSAVMGLLSDRLRKDGHLIVFEHNPYNPITRRIVDRCPFDADAILLKPRELASLGIRAGLEHLRTDYTLFFPRFLDVLRRLERGLAWLPLGGQYVTLFRKIC